MCAKNTTRGRPQIISDDELLDAARSVFLEQAAGATTAAIARKARVAESVIFHRFKTKEALFIAVLEREAGHSGGLRDIEEQAGKGEVSDTLFDVATSVVEKFKSLAPVFMLANMLSRAPRWKLQGFIEKRMRQPPPAYVQDIQCLSRFLRAEAELGRLRRVDAESTARFFLGALMQYAMEQYMFGAGDLSSPATQRSLRVFVDIVVLGLMPRAQASPR